MYEYREGGGDWGFGETIMRYCMQLYSVSLYNILYNRQTFFFVYHSIIKYHVYRVKLTIEEKSINKRTYTSSIRIIYLGI